MMVQDLQPATFKITNTAAQRALSVAEIDAQRVNLFMQKLDGAFELPERAAIISAYLDYMKGNP